MGDEKEDSASTSGTVGPALYLKRRKPSTFANIVNWSIWIGILVIIASSFIGLDFGWGVFLTVIILLAVLANDHLNPRSSLNKFRESYEQVTATVIRRRVKEHSDSYGDKSYTYSLTVRFDHVGRPVELEAWVSKKVYDMHPRDSLLGVRYAAGNPRIALLQGEFDSLI